MNDKSASNPTAIAPARPSLDYGIALSVPLGSSDAPESYAADLRRLVASLPADVVAHVEGYVPRELARHPRPGMLDFVRLAVFAVAPRNKHTVTQTAAAVASLTAWAHESHGLPLKYRLLLSSEVIGRWQADVLKTGSLSTGTMRNYRGHLARISHALGVELNPKFDAVTRTSRIQPYSADDIARALLWTRTLSPTMQMRAQVLLSLAAGAGLTPQEILHVRARDILTAGGMWVKVESPRPRLTPVLESWRPRLRTLAEATPASELLFPRDEGEVSPTFMKDWLVQYPTKRRPMTQRLRVGWIVEMLGTEPDDSKTLIYAGIERGETLAGYLPFLGEVDRARRASLLRLRVKIPGITGESTHETTPEWGV